MTAPSRIATLIEEARALALAPEQNLLKMLAQRRINRSGILRAKREYAEASTKMQEVLNELGGAS